MTKNRQIQFSKEDWSLFIPIEEKDLDLAKYKNFFRSDEFVFVKEFKIFIITPEIGSRVNKILFGENKDDQKALTQSLLSRIEKIDWTIDIPDSDYLIKKDGKEAIVRFVTVSGAMKVYDHINTICHLPLFDSFPPFHITIMTKGIEEGDLPLLSSTEEILELQPERLKF